MSRQFFSADEVGEILQGDWLRPPSGAPRADSPLKGVGIDTRPPVDLGGKAFFAIAGLNHDGHDFLAAAIAAGAELLIVEKSLATELPGPRHPAVLKVPDTRRAMGMLAAAWRDTLRTTTVIAITGSAGKTTTRRLIHAALSTRLRGSQSPKSFNNEIGVPLTLLAARPEDDFVVVEIGTNAPGEIDSLAEIVRPDIAVITSIGRAHLEKLGGIEGVAREKASLLQHLAGDGMAVVNADAPLLRPLLPRNRKTVTFGHADDATLRLTGRVGSATASAGSNRSLTVAAHQSAIQSPKDSVSAAGDHQWFEINGRRRFTLPLPGEHNAINAMAAVAVAEHLGVSDSQIDAGLSAVTGAEMRLALIAIGDVRLCNDAYNANPDSVRAALNAFAEIAGDAARRIVILGDMLELGPDGPALHREVARTLIDIHRRSPIAHVALIGPLSRHTALAIECEFAGRVSHFPTLDTATGGRIAALLRPGDCVLLKGSRGMALERILPHLKARFRSDATSAACVSAAETA